VKREIHIWSKGDNTIIPSRGSMKHCARLLFTIYFTIGKTIYPKELLYCPQLDYVDINAYVFGRRKCKR
jgi:hypothetical protein